MAFKTWVAEELLTSSDLNANFTECISYYSTTIDYATPPIGSIVAYHINWAYSNGSIPSGWLDCNGQVVNDAQSPLNGATLPSLNGTTDDDKRFLRGHNISGEIGGAATHTHTYNYAANDIDNNVNSYRADYIFMPSSNIPPYFEIRWIIRIK